MCPPPLCAATGDAGCFVGVSSSDYNKLLLAQQRGGTSALTPYNATGAALSVTAGRVAYTFNLRGPAVAVDTGGAGRGVAGAACSRAALRAPRCTAPGRRAQGGTGGSARGLWGVPACTAWYW